MNNQKRAEYYAERAELARKQRRCLFCAFWVAPTRPGPGSCLRLNTSTLQHELCSMFDPLPNPDGWTQ